MWNIEFCRGSFQITNDRIRFPLSALELQQLFSALGLLLGEISPRDYLRRFCESEPDTEPAQQAMLDILHESEDTPGVFILRLWRNDPMTKNPVRFEYRLSMDDAKDLLSMQDTVIEKFIERANDDDMDDDDEDDENDAFTDDQF
ncbi:hypothetical protein Q31b_50920 [Novipirellula aureliae]|uniref:Uncharacterized protein n=1 Tax=Novipirellula aureliae TaxID=2527966 RepID=A0A5C6DIG9_9BACT|nr:hypothetical protein [Novipirellula aureliae]TWU35657.1 hypothetical protein Q31b_50920 [Novipirellula aureliae]